MQINKETEANIGEKQTEKGFGKFHTRKKQQQMPLVVNNNDKYAEC